VEPKRSVPQNEEGYIHLIVPLRDDVYVSHPPVQGFHPRAKSFDNLSNPFHFCEFVLQLIDLSEDFVEASYLCIGHFDCIARAVILDCSGILSLLV
jgi:hypothetical protein